MLIGVGFASHLGRSQLSRPIRAMTDAMSALADGRLATEVPYLGRVDEIGGMARAVEVFKRNAVEREELTRARASDGAALEQRNRRVSELIAGFERKIESLVVAFGASASEMQSTAETMRASADQGRDRSESGAGGFVGEFRESAARTGSAADRVLSAARKLTTSADEVTREVESFTTGIRAA